MIDRVKDQPLMVRVGTQIRFVEQGVADLQARLEIAIVLQAAAEAEQALRADGGSGTVYRFVIVVRVGRRWSRQSPRLASPGAPVSQ